MRKLRLPLCILLTVLLTLSLTAAAWAVPDVDPFVKIHDFTDTLGAGDMETLTQQAQGIVDEYGLDVVVVLTQDTEGQTTRNYANDFYDNNGFGMGADQDGILLLLNLQAHELYISTSGFGIDNFGDTYISYMLDGISGHYANDDYYGAVSTYLYFVEQQMSLVRENPAMATTRSRVSIEEAIPTPGSEPSRSRSSGGTFGIVWKAGLIAILITAAVAAVLVALQRSSMPGAPDTARLYLEGNVNVTAKQDVFLRTNTTRTPISGSKEGGGPAANSGSNGNVSTTHRSSSGKVHGGGGRKVSK